jgi:rhodanese-related sulfurtransferase
MSSFTEISVSRLSRLVGLPDSPAIIDVRIDEDYAADPRMIPGSCRRPHDNVGTWAPAFTGRPVIVTCQKGLKLSQGVAALLRHAGIQAETLAGGFEAWRDAGEQLVCQDHLPTRDREGRTLWVTRSRPKIDRIACPWLIRRFIEPDAVFLYITASEVGAVAERFGATPFDMPGGFWSHRDDLCTFDVMLREFGLRSEALDRLAVIVRAADTDRHGLAPEAAGLLAVSLGYSRRYRDDLEQMDAMMDVYDGLYRWCRDAVDETHDWPGQRGGDNGGNR